MTEVQLLKLLKSRYEKKYVSTLINRFPKPLIMFDDKQIRLRRQIESLLERIENSVVCPKCKGRGVVFEENEYVPTTDPHWIDSWFDSRIIRNDQCEKCFGDGIVLSDRQYNEFGFGFLIAKAGIVVNTEDVDNLVCQICKKELEWELLSDASDPSLEAKCHGIVYKLRARTFSLSINMDKQQEQ